MSFIFAKWATVHALNPMGPIASYLKAHNLSGAPSYFMISHYFNITCNPNPRSYFFATQWTASTPAATFSPPPTWTAPLLDAVQAMKPSAVLQHGVWMTTCSPKNGVSNGAWTALRWWLRCALNGAWTTPSNSAWTALVIAPKMALQRA